MIDKMSLGSGPLDKPADSGEKIPAKPMRLLVNGKAETLDSEIFLEGCKVTNWVRLPDAEFDDNFETIAAGQLIDHFNLGTPNHVVGKRYVFMRIVESDPAKVLPPVLSTKDAFIVECVAVADNVFETIQEDEFKHSLKGITDKASLKAVIKTRYNASDEDIARRGIARTAFKVVGRLEQ